jgi:PAS domain S-box-containing protein
MTGEHASAAPPDTTILVVDDSAPGRYVTCRILRREGYPVIEAATGQEALDQAASQPAMIVLDVKLPDFSGFEVCRRLRADPATAHIPVLHLSSTFLDEGSVITGLEGGADGYLTLPVEPPVLLAYVRALLRVGQVLRTLQQSEARFRSLFESMGDGLLLADPVARRFRMANPAICELLGYSQRELESMWITDIHPAEALERTRMKFSEVVQGRIILVPGLPVRHKDGSILHVDIGNTLLTIDNRTMVLGSFRDVTERRAIEQRLAQSDRLASVGLLAAGVAHELNNPLAYVLYNLEGMADELRKSVDQGRLPSPERLRELLERAEAAEEGARRMRGIVHDLQTFSRAKPKDDKAMELGPMIQAVATMAANQIRFRARLKLDLHPTPTVLGSEGRLSQVFLNLLVNAAQAIDEGNPEGNRITVRTGVTGDHCRIEFEDTGRGIEPEQLTRLFDPFFTTKQPGEGTGLGLAICHRIVEEHGGHIEVVSTPGEGSRFTVLLPCAGRSPADAPDAPQSLPESVPPPRIAPRLLIVDDEPHLLKAMRRLLQRAGYQVVTANSGAEAQRALTDGAEFDVILCDLMMPDIMGMDLHAWLLARDPRQAQRLVFLTGGTFTPRAQDYLASAGNPVLAKPLPRAELMAAIEAVIERYGPGTA